MSFEMNNHNENTVQGSIIRRNPLTKQPIQGIKGSGSDRRGTMEIDAYNAHGYNLYIQERIQSESQRRIS